MKIPPLAIPIALGLGLAVLYYIHTKNNRHAFATRKKKRGWRFDVDPLDPSKRYSHTHIHLDPNIYYPSPHFLYPGEKPLSI